MSLSIDLFPSFSLFSFPKCGIHTIPRWRVTTAVTISLWLMIISTGLTLSSMQSPKTMPCLTSWSLSCRPTLFYLHWHFYFLLPKHTGKMYNCVIWLYNSEQYLLRSIRKSWERWQYKIKGTWGTGFENTGHFFKRDLGVLASRCISLCIGFAAF